MNKFRENNNFFLFEKLFMVIFADRIHFYKWLENV